VLSFTAIHFLAFSLKEESDPTSNLNITKRSLQLQIFGAAKW
jgi:hypothetical protein